MAIINNRVRTYNGFYDFLGRVFSFFRLYKHVLFILHAPCIIMISLLFIPTYLSEETSGIILDYGGKVYRSLEGFVSSCGSNIRSYSALLKENERLKKALEDFHDMHTNLKTIEAENLELKKLLFVVSDAQYSYNTARVLSVVSNPFSDSMKINIGLSKGVSENMVVTDGRYLIGRISSSGRDYSTVSTISTSESRVPVVAATSGERGVLVFEKEGLRISYLDSDHKIRVGETILTSGDGFLYPGGIPVGQVEKVSEKGVWVKRYANLDRIGFVTIVKPSREVRADTYARNVVEY
jgi:rod shape-determining protein MreC